MEKMTVRDIDVSSKRVLVRVDFNVPLDEKTGAITDDTRIREALPTIKYLIDRGARVILCSHLGQPKGKVVDSLRMTPIGERLTKLLDKRVAVAPDCIGPEVEKAAAKLGKGDIMLLENLRFHAQEEQNDPAFAQKLAKLADVYVDDAFGTAHRAHASTAGVARYLPAVSGLLMEKELQNLGGILTSPARPFAALTGGAKVSDKIDMLQNIMGKVDAILVGGGMAATFLKAKSYEVGQSLIEEDKVDLTGKLMDTMQNKGVRCLLPVDVLVAERIEAGAGTEIVPVDKIPKQLRIVDIGPKTIENFSNELKRCKTIFWNGPMGIYEIPQFAEGTKRLATLLAGLKATTVIGGGSTADAVTDMKLADKMTFVSTGGGASLTFLSGKPLPGVEALQDKKK
ncbi:MAG: phosphoglycerate kinase [Chloroflexi bacterium]|nr:phosphoglycerate kinase [Chloroflexota bacterium]